MLWSYDVFNFLTRNKIRCLYLKVCMKLLVKILGSIFDFLINTFFGVLVLIICVIISISLFVLTGFKYECGVSWKDSGYEHRFVYSIFKCQVKIDEDKWVNSDQVIFNLNKGK